MLDLTLENEYRLSITIDIEDWYHIPSVTGSPFSVYKDVNEFFKRWTGRRYDYLTEPTKRVLDMLDEFDFGATFFVVADVVDHYPGLVESIVSVNSLYNKTDSSLERVSSYPYYPKKAGLEIGEEKFVEFPWAYWNVFGFNFKIPTSGGPMLRFLGAHVILTNLKDVNKVCLKDASLGAAIGKSVKEEGDKA
jgi:peptidoglycan/xylan/chitin deacetylase (PgdA/CDA1 family)